MTASDPVVAALRRLPVEMATRALHEITAWVRHRQTLADAAARGVRTAPLYRRPLCDQMAIEATRRARSDDRTWILWDAYAAQMRRSQPASDDGEVS